MEHAKPLPPYLVDRYQGWTKDRYPAKQEALQTLVSDGQHPKALVVSCCDSRVHVTDIFGADQGEIFLHRNIANLVPPNGDDETHVGTAAVLQYGILALGVSHVIVLGHSQCGGVKGCVDMCKGDAPELEADDSFVGRWIDLLKPGYAQVEAITDPEKQLRQMEKQGVRLSLENLMTYPWLAEKVEAGELTLHGLWTDIAEGRLEFFNAEAGEFEPV